MTVISEFYVDANMSGTAETFTLPDGYRYMGIWFGSALANHITSMRASAAGGLAHVYGFNENNFQGRYASLNMQDGHVSWWSLQGRDTDDNIESAIVVARYPKGEMVLDLGEQIRPEFVKQFDAKAAGTPVRRNGEPRVFTLFWPGHAPGKIFVSVEQNLIVDPPDYPWDYAAQVRYDIDVYRTADGSIDAYVYNTYIWVEGGLITGQVMDALKPKMVEGAASLTQALRAKLADLPPVKVKDVYLLPGPKPTSAAGDTRDARDGSSLVLVL